MKKRDINIRSGISITSGTSGSRIKDSRLAAATYCSVHTNRAAALVTYLKQQEALKMIIIPTKILKLDRKKKG